MAANSIVHDLTVREKNRVLMTETIVSLLRCPKGCGASANERQCGGRLEPRNDHLRCRDCNRDYEVVDGIPVLYPDAGPETDNSFYEAMYEGRSREQELAGSYLWSERELVRSLVGKFGIEGPSLEVGCGTGLFAGQAPSYVGLEYSLTSLRVPGFEMYDRICGDATRLPFAPGSFELLFSFNAYEHVPAVDQAFAELDRVCAPGGFLILKPAWHCTRHVTELIHILPYSRLSWRKKAVKALLPVIKSGPCKFATHIPWRLWRRATAGSCPKLSWTKLTPYRGPLWEADTDAAAGLDCHEGIMYFVRRGYQCHSHPGVLQQLLARHDVVVLQKPAGRASQV